MADTPDFRSEGLLCAVRTCATVVTDLLARHPRAAALRQLKPQATSLSQLLWDELVAAERESLAERAERYLEPTEGTPAQYWQRRRRLAEWQAWQRVEAELPPLWLKLLEMPAQVT